MKRISTIDVLRLLALLVFASILAVPVGAVAVLAIALPDLDDDVATEAVGAPVALRRDAVGVVSIEASSMRDAAWAMGYAHAQDRFFQMDLTRRTAAGEMSELFGRDLLESDLAQRRWQLRELAREQFAVAPENQRAIVRAYTRGVNAGLDDLRLKPFEYVVLRKTPQPWREEDSLLVIHAMFLMLTDSTAKKEQFLARLKRTLPEDAFRFVTWDRGGWDSSFLDPQVPIAPPPLPAPPAREPVARAHALPAGTPGFVGSSAWAVSGRRTAHPQGLLAVDMHLGLSVPNLWYRAEIHLPQNGSTRAPASIYGLTLPGFPGIVVGSNGRIAWGLSNTQGDWADLIALTPCRAGGSPGYRVDNDCVAYRAADETIRVADAPSTPARFLLTRWGPLVNRDPVNKPLVRRWLGDSRAATNLTFLDLLEAHDVEAAIRIARASGVPPVNFVVADSGGHIGWTIAGQLPDRSTGCAIDPQPAASARVDDWTRLNLQAADLQVIDPPSGYLVTANQRILPASGTPIVCDAAYQFGARARQIADAIGRSPTLDEAAAMRIQLDDRALLLTRWRDLMLAAIAARPDPDDGKYDTVVARLRAWDRHASADSVAYRIIREYRDAVSGDVLSLLASGSGLTAAELYDNLPQAEYPVWTMVSQRPAGWLPAGYPDWDAYLRSILDRNLKRYEADDPDLTRTTWGERNRLGMQHPMFGRIPLLGRFFGMPDTPMSGDTHMPHVQAPGFGASQRMVVAPGREKDGLLQMPGGQSSNPLSRYFDAGHAQWVAGEPLPLMAGKIAHEIRIRPDRDGR
ncbi:MAG: penicillin acylase family protein [Pseudomonadota bacterium]